MGNDLYWKITPKPVEEEYNGLHMSTWYFLAEYMGAEEKENLDELVFDSSRLSHLCIMKLTAETCRHPQLIEDLTELIEAIKKYGSITLNVRG